jgi:hypothetical protein
VIAGEPVADVESVLAPTDDDTVTPPAATNKPPAVIVKPLDAVNPPPIVAPPEVTDKPPAATVTNPSPRTLNLSPSLAVPCTETHH